MPQPLDRFARDVTAYFGKTSVSYIGIGDRSDAALTTFAEAGLNVGRAVLLAPETTLSDLQDTIGSSGFEIEIAAADYSGHDSGTQIDQLVRSFPDAHLSILALKEGVNAPAAIGTAHASLAASAIDIVYAVTSLEPDESGAGPISKLQDVLLPHGYRLYKIYDQRHDTEHDRPVLQDFGAVFLSPDMIARHPLSVVEENQALRRALDDATAQNAVLTAELKRELDRRYTENAALSEMLSAMQPVQGGSRDIHLRHAQRGTRTKRGPLDLSPVWRSRRRQKLALVLIAVWLVGLLAYSSFTGA